MMKRIVKTIIYAFAAILAVSCAKSASLATAISVDRTSVTIDGANPEAVTVRLTADGEWYSFCPAWIKVTPSHGNGPTEVKVTATPNVDSYDELQGPRADMLVFWSDEKISSSITVNQTGEPGLDVTRTYRRVTGDGDIDPAKGILIAAPVGDSYLAATALDATDESSYGYLTGDSIKPDSDGSVTLTSRRLTWRLVARDGGYVLCQPNGYYIFMMSGFNNFHPTKNIENADVWTLTVGEDGSVTLFDTAVGLILQLTTDYNTFGAYSGLRSDGILPQIFIDSQKASDEVLVVEETRTVLASCTSVSIPVESNATWKVRNHSGWIKSFTKSGAGNGSIEITFDPNDSESSDNVAEFTVIGETFSRTFTLVQSKRLCDLKSLSAFVAAKATRYEAGFDSVTVSYVASSAYGDNVFLRDKTGGMLLFLTDSGFKAGDVLTGPTSGGCTLYKGLPELSSIDRSSLEIGSGTVAAPDTVSLAVLLKDFSKYVSCMVYVKDVTFVTGVSASSKTGKITDASEASVEAVLKAAPFTVEDGAAGDILCIPTVNNDVPQVGIWEQAHFKAKK